MMVLCFRHPVEELLDSYHSQVKLALQTEVSLENILRNDLVIILSFSILNSGDDIGLNILRHFKLHC